MFFNLWVVELDLHSLCRTLLIRYLQPDSLWSGLQTQNNLYGFRSFAVFFTRFVECKSTYPTPQNPALNSQRSRFFRNVRKPQLMKHDPKPRIVLQNVTSRENMWIFKAHRHFPLRCRIRGLTSKQLICLTALDGSPHPSSPRRLSVHPERWLRTRHRDASPFLPELHWCFLGDLRSLVRFVSFWKKRVKSE